MTLEEIEARWKAATPGPWAYDSDDSAIWNEAGNCLVIYSTEYEPDGLAIAAAPTDIAYLLDRVRKLEDCKQRVRAKLAACDAEATIRGLSATGFPRLWFASLSRAVGLELRSPLASMTGTGNEGSIPLAAALDSLSSPALAEMRLQMEKYKRAHAWLVEDSRCDCEEWGCWVEEEGRRVLMQYDNETEQYLHHDQCGHVAARDLKL